jgi:hypothetical protein
LVKGAEEEHGLDSFKTSLRDLTSWSRTSSTRATHMCQMVELES